MAASYDHTDRAAGGFYQYSSTTPGFSTFMILGQVGDSGAGEAAGAPDSGTESDSTPTPDATSTKGTPGFGLLLGMSYLQYGIMSHTFLQLPFFPFNNLP